MNLNSVIFYIYKYKIAYPIMKANRWMIKNYKEKEFLLQLNEQLQNARW